MKKYLFDANAISLWFEDNLPEKWTRQWKEVRMGTSKLILIEPLISETYYKNVPKYGKKRCKEKVYWMKALPKIYIHPLDDNDAILAGDIKTHYKGKGLSLVDCFLIAVAKANNAKIFTTDTGVRDIARSEKVQVDYLPFKRE